MNARFSPARGLLGALLLAAVAPCASADELQFGVRAGANYSDNVERVPVDETSTGAMVAGFDVTALRETGRLTYDAFGSVEYQDYIDSDVESETFGQMFGRVAYGFVPDRFLWRLSGSYDQARQDLLRPLAPGNLENITTLSTGPQLTLMLGRALESTIEGHYTVADYSERPFDSDTTGGSLVVGHRPHSNLFIGLGGSADKMDYKEEVPQVQDFDRREFFLRLSARGARTDINLDAGYSEAKGETFDEDGPTIRLDATRELTRALSGFVRYTYGFPTSAGAAFTPDEPLDVDADPSVLTGGPRQSEDAEIGLEWFTGRTDASLRYIAREEVALDTDVERSFDIFAASLSRSLTPRASLGLTVRYSDESLEGIASDEQRYGLNFSVRVGRLLSIVFGLEHSTRDSDAPQGNYSENSGGIFLRYGTSARAGS
jgi:hypothetical protein